MPFALQANVNQLNLGWITLPSGAITNDTVNHIVKQSTGGQVWATDHSPQLFGVESAVWSNAINGWVPTATDLLAPDGIHYVYSGDDGKIHIGNAQSGQEAFVPNPERRTILAYTNAGIVLASETIAPQGLWLLDPATQTISAITPPTGNYQWAAAAGGYAWGVDSPGVLGYPASKKVISAQIVPNPQIINPQSTATVLYTAPSGQIIGNLAPDTKGGVLVMLSGNAQGLVYLPLGGSPTPYQMPPGIALPNQGGLYSHADAHGIWLSTDSAIFLFNTATGLQRIAANPIKSAFQPSGDCV